MNFIMWMRFFHATLPTLSGGRTHRGQFFGMRFQQQTNNMDSLTCKLNGSCGSASMFGGSLAASSAFDDDVKPWDFAPKVTVLDPGTGELFSEFKPNKDTCVNCSAQGMTAEDHYLKCVKPGPNQLAFRLRFCTPDRFVSPDMGAGRVTTTNERDNTTFNLTKRGGARDSSQGTLLGARASAFREGSLGGLKDAAWVNKKSKVSPIGRL